jgi:serpin B
MNRQFRFGIPVLLTAGLLVPTLMQQAACSPNTSNVKQVVAANTSFGFHLLHKLDETSPSTNVFFSPFSITQALSLTLNGAGAPTDAVMSKTLCLGSLSLADVNTANGVLLPSLSDPDPMVQMSIANALWINKGQTLNSDFKGRCHRYYKATTSTLNLNVPSGADTINFWVKAKTHGKIDKLVRPMDINGSPTVLTNAVYFHGKWTTPFDKSDTRPGSFTLEDGSTKTVPFMSKEWGFKFLSTPTFKAVSIPYGTGRMSMYVFLPAPGTSVDSMASALNESTWQATVDKMLPVVLTLDLPQFKASYSVALKPALSSLGMASAFNQANFKPMGLPRGYIGNVIHEAVLDVDEEGTTAAAATAVVMRSHAIRRTIEMRVDHPFFCAIRDNDTGTIVFMGVVRDPE